jgi:hypothetical protein
VVCALFLDIPNPVSQSAAVASEAG